MLRTPARLAIVLALFSLFVQQPARAVTTYQQPVWFTWNTADLDVWIVPPRHGQVINGNGVLGGGDIAKEVNPLTMSYMRAIWNSIKDWERAIIAYGSSGLKSGLGCAGTNCSKIKKFVIGDPNSPQPPAGSRPEIVVTADEDKTFVLGIAIKSSGPCLVLNSSFFIESMTYESMFGINAQEYGHCLGLNHVDEVNGQAGEAKLVHDPMNGQFADDPSQAGIDLHCISNLNVKGLEEVFHGPLGTGTGAAFGSLSASSYVRPRYAGASPPTWGCIF